MSLINKMLQDLEARERTTAPSASEKKLYDDAYPVSAPRRRIRPFAVLAGLGALIVVAGGATYFITRPATQLAKEVAAPVAVAEAKPDVAPLSVQAPVAEPPAPAEPAVAAALPPAETQKPEEVPSLDKPKTETVRLTPVPAPTPPEPVAEKTEKSVAPLAETVPNAVAPKAAAPKVERPKPAPKAPTPKIVATEAATDAAAGATSSRTPGTVEKRDRVLSPEEKAEAYYLDAGTLIANGKTDDARATLAAALAAYPAHHRARELAAAFALQNGRAREAQGLLQDGVRLAPQHVPFALLLARLQVEQGGDAQAVATLENARAAGATDAGYLSFLAALYQRAGRHADAIKSYRDALALRPQDARSWLGLAISLEGVQDGSAAADAYNRALGADGLDSQLAGYAQQRLATLRPKQ